MSLILDALKRAERERRAGQAPQPLDPVAAPAVEPAVRPGRRWALPALVVAALLAVAAIAVVALKRPLADAASTATATAAPAPAIAAGATVPPVIAPDAKLDSLDDLVDDPARTPSPQAGAETRAELPQAAPGHGPAREGSVATGKPESGRLAAASTPSGPLVADSDDEVPPSLRPEAGGTSDPVRPPPPVFIPAGSTAAPPPAAAAEKPAAATPTPTPTPEAARSYREMSPAYRADFPPLTVDVHVYNDAPQRRFVILNGKRYHEGDTIAEGPRIVGIVVDGIVFDWRGQRVVYGLSSH